MEVIAALRTSISESRDDLRIGQDRTGRTGFDSGAGGISRGLALIPGKVVAKGQPFGAFRAAH
jgi:hypothetical protein